jgi:hypothetical protein
VMRPHITYGGLRFDVPWARAWAVAGVYIVSHLEDLTHHVAHLLCMARIRLLVHAGVKGKFAQW